MNGNKAFEERDPTGAGQHTGGVKLDGNKVRVGLVLGGFADALFEVSRVGTFGAQKYSDNGWKTVPNGLGRYQDAEWRHLLQRNTALAPKGEGDFDADSGLLHLAHEAWNALATLQKELERRHAENRATMRFPFGQYHKPEQKAPQPLDARPYLYKPLADVLDREAAARANRREGDTLIKAQADGGLRMTGAPLALHTAGQGFVLTECDGAGECGNMHPQPQVDRASNPEARAQMATYKSAAHDGTGYVGGYAGTRFAEFGDGRPRPVRAG